MLPNNETTIVTDILDKTSGQHPVKDYKLEIIEQSKLAEATVSSDGKKLIIKSNDKTGVGCCYEMCIRDRCGPLVVGVQAQLQELSVTEDVLHKRMIFL